MSSPKKLFVLSLAATVLATLAIAALVLTGHQLVLVVLACVAATS